MSVESRFPAIRSVSARGTSTALVPHTPPPRQKAAADDEIHFSSPAGMASVEVELAQLKQKYREQQQRLSSPVNTPRRPDGLSKYQSVAGQNYAMRPYHKIPSKKMWEPSFSTDKDVVELYDRLQRSEERIESRKREMEVHWKDASAVVTAAAAVKSTEQRQLFTSAPVGQVEAVAVGAKETPTSQRADVPPLAPQSGTVSNNHTQKLVFPTGNITPTNGSKPPSRQGSAKNRPSSRPGSGSHRGEIPEMVVDDIAFIPNFQVEHPDGSKDMPMEASGVLGHSVNSRGKDHHEGGHQNMLSPEAADIHNALRRRTSSVKVSQGTIAVLKMLQNKNDIVLPAPKESGWLRGGDVLNATHVLKQDLFEAAFTRRDLVGVMSGAPYFRMVPKFHIGGVAQAHSHGIRTALNALRKAQTNYGPIVWINLREEPLIYLNGKSHIIRSKDNPFKPQIIPNISGTRISMMEEKLKKEILQEALANQGNICVHHESANGTMDEQWESVEEDELLTIEELFKKFNDKGLDIAYQRRPITQGAAPQPADFQYVLDLCHEHPEAPLIFNCQTGRGRSSLMMLIASIVRFYQMCTQDINADVTLLRGDGKANSFRSLQKLISLLPDGALHERRVAVLMELSDKIYSVADHINAAFKSGEMNEKSRMRLAQYAYLLMFSCYCEQYFWLQTTTLTFPQWIDDFQELRVLVSNITAPKSAPLIEERITTPLDVADNAEVSNWIRSRKGHVLSGNMILRSSPKEIVDAAATAIPGVLALRQLASGTPFFTCGRVSEHGRGDLLYNIRTGFPKVNKIHWISLRAEPMVFINDVGYSLLDYAVLHHENELVGEMTNTMHVSRERLEEIEERLVKDIHFEAGYNGGVVLVHRQNDDGTTEALKLHVQSVHTPKSVMDEFAVNAGIHYVRIPMPYFGSIYPTDMDPLVGFFQELYSGDDVDDDDEAIIINDADGTMRTTVALNIASIVKASRKKRLRDIRTTADLHDVLRVPDNEFVVSNARCYAGMEEEETLPQHHNELQVASVALQMVAAGSLLKITDAAIDLGGAGARWNLLHAIDIAKTHLSPSDKSSPAVLAAVELVRKYMMVLLATAYIDEQVRGQDSALGKKFSEWIEDLSEITNILDRLDERPLHTLKYVVRENLMASTVNDRAVDRRCGDVLTANFAMKADHFPGCQKKGLRPQVCGAPNFRKVDNINVFGVAIPTIVGVHNLLSVLGASDRALTAFPNETNDEEMWLGYATPRVFDPSFDTSTLHQPLVGNVVWVNLREEPIIYVGDRPFVFRDMQTPYVNVELTGIEAEKIELVEDSLKGDILREAQQYDGNFLVHDEGKPGELVGTWEVATEHTVKTVRQVYNEAAASGMRVKFLRLPVTDEQSPELKDFDMLVENLLPEILKTIPATHATSFVFNCQMGRGRTTTGMVVCSLLLGLVYPDYYEFLDRKYPQLFTSQDSELSQGNYTCIQQLKSVLTDGRAAKHRLDLILEACSKMQNLRSAIEGFAVQVSSPDVTEEARARALHHGVHYLQRYFNLIAFVSYLEEEFDRENLVLRKSFEAWIGERPELVSLHDTAALS